MGKHEKDDHKHDKHHSHDKSGKHDHHGHKHDHHADTGVGLIPALGIKTSPLPASSPARSPGRVVSFEASSSTLRPEQVTTLRPEQVAALRTSSQSMGTTVAKKLPFTMVRRKDPLDLCNEVITTLRNHDTMIRNVQGNIVRKIRSEVGESMKEDRRRNGPKAAKAFRTKFLMRAWWRLTKSGQAFSEMQKPAQGKTDAEAEKDAESESAEKPQPRRRPVCQHSCRGPAEISALEKSRYDPEETLAALWRVREESSWYPIGQVLRVEKHRGLMGKLLVPDYTKEDYDDLITRPARFPSRSRMALDSRNLPGEEELFDKEQAEKIPEPTTLKPQDFRNEEITVTLERPRNHCAFFKGQTDKEKEMERTCEAKWSEKFGKGDTKGGAHIPQQRKIQKVPHWF